MTKVISNVLQPTAEPLGELVAHAENLSSFIGSFLRLAQAAARFGQMSGHVIAAADDVLDGFREVAKTIRALEHRDAIDPEDHMTSVLAAFEEHLSASLRTLDDTIERQRQGPFVRPLRRLSEKQHAIFEEVEALRIYILEHDADADPETVGPFETAEELIKALDA